MPQDCQGIGDLLKDAVYEGAICPAIGQKQHGHEPSWSCTATGQVVGADVDSVPPQLLGGKRDRVGLRHEVAIAHIDDCRVLADAGANDDARVRPGMALQQVGEQGHRKLAHRIDALSHSRPNRRPALCSDCMSLSVCSGLPTLTRTAFGRCVFWKTRTSTPSRSISSWSVCALTRTQRTE